MFRINLLKGFLYPLSAPKRLLAAWLILPLSLAILVPPMLFGLGVLGTVDMSLKQGLGFTLMVVAACIVAGAFPFTFLGGYMIRCRKQVIEGNPTLPAWSGWKELLEDGGRMDTLALLVGLPTIALFWGALSTVGLTLKNLYDHVTWTSAFLALLGSGAGLALLLCAVAVWLSAMFYTPMASLRLAMGHPTIRALSVRGMWLDFKKGWFDYLLCCALVWGISMVFSMAQTTFWPLIVVSFPVQVYLQLVWASLLGQYARAYLLEP